MGKVRKSRQDSGEHGRGRNHPRKGHRFADGPGRGATRIPAWEAGGKPKSVPDRADKEPRAGRCWGQICTAERVHRAGLGVPEEESTATTAKTREQVIHTKKKSTISDISRFAGKTAAWCLQGAAGKSAQEDQKLLPAIQTRRQQVTIRAGRSVGDSVPVLE